MKIIADFHIHIYPFYSLELFFMSLLKNFQKIKDADKNCIYAIFLAERYDCNFYSDIISQQKEIKSKHFKIIPANDNNVLKIVYDNDYKIFIFPGRQVVTKERLEILSLCSDKQIKDNLSLNETINEIKQSQSFPVLSWAPGKWFFNRGKIVKTLLHSISPDLLFIGDTYLRPKIWMEPNLMKNARKQNFKVLAGSDPLPFSGEEKYAGKYYSIFEGNFEEENALESMKKILSYKHFKPVSKGTRPFAWQTLYRLYKNSKAKSKC